MDIILFNGPPRCGKDTAAKFLRDNWDSLDLSDTPILRRMSHPHKEMFAKMVDAAIDDDGIVEWWEENKDQASALLNRRSYRQWQIDFSESFMKPLYGEDIFGKLFANYAANQSPSTTFLVPDCGFEIEADAISRFLPKATMHLVRIHRPGTSFAGDSRSYINPPSISPSRIINIMNDSTLEEFHGQLTLWFQSAIGFRSRR